MPVGVRILLMPRPVCRDPGFFSTLVFEPVQLPALEWMSQITITAYDADPMVDDQVIRDDA
jgi:hypothetical protein